MLSNGAIPYFFPVSSITAFTLIFGLFEPLYFKYKFKEKNGLAVIFKCAATVVAVVLAVFGAVYQKNSYTWVLCAGLAVCAAADGLICRSFMAGLLAFLFAHSLFIISFLTAAPFKPVSVIIFIIGLIALAVVLVLINKNGIKNKLIVPGTAYFVVIHSMVSLALPITYTAGLRNGIPAGLAAAVGALLFMTSDILLARNLMISYSRKNDIISLSVYYLGVYCLALWAVVPALI